MSLSRVYWIVWWLAVITSACVVLFFGVAPSLVGTALLGYGDSFNNWYLFAPALLAVIAFVWGARARRSAYLSYRIVWWLAVLSNVFVAFQYGRLVTLTVILYALGPDGDIDWFQVAVFGGTSGSALLAAIALLWAGDARNGRLASSLSATRRSCRRRAKTMTASHCGRCGAATTTYDEQEAWHVCGWQPATPASVQRLPHAGRMDAPSRGVYIRGTETRSSGSRRS